MVRRVKAYLANMKVITDEERLHALSIDCEPHAGAVAIAAAVPLAGNRGRRHPSPTLSTTSSASSTSEGRKSIQGLTPCSIISIISTSEFVYLYFKLKYRVATALLNQKIPVNFFVK